VKLTANRMKVERRSSAVIIRSDINRSVDMGTTHLEVKKGTACLRRYSEALLCKSDALVEGRAVNLQLPGCFRMIPSN